MISTVSKAVITGLTCTTLGLGLGGVWATQLDSETSEPMRTLFKPEPVSVIRAPRASEPAPTEMLDEPQLVEHRELPAPASAHPPKQAEPAPAPLAVKRLVVTDRLVGREPAPSAALKADGSEVIAFVELMNRGQTAHRIEIVFEHESGQKVGFVKLPVPEDRSRWRTWGKTRQIKKSGHWVASVRDEAGAELMRQAFIVEPS